MGSFYELLQKRRMVRHYTGEPATREALERIAATVRRAPSAARMSPRSSRACPPTAPCDAAMGTER